MEIKINIPDGISGDWKIETFNVSKEAAKLAAMRAMFQGRGFLSPGDYKILMYNGSFVMSNTPDEIKYFRMFLYRAKGKILINGMGLGVLIQALLSKSEVTEITVIEKSEDVIKLVAPTYLKDKRVSVIHADAFDWIPPKGKHYDYIWHDIWNNICSDNLPGMKKLTRKYGRKADYQESWCRYECEQKSKQVY